MGTAGGRRVNVTNCERRQVQVRLEVAVASAGILEETVAWVQLVAAAAQSLPLALACEGIAMERPKKRGTWTTAAMVAVAFLAGLVALMLLFPYHGHDTDPPRCFSMFDYVVPCGAGLSFATGAATVGVIGTALWLKRRRS